MIAQSARKNLRNNCLLDVIAGWWFGTFFIFPYIGNNHPNLRNSELSQLRPPAEAPVLGTWPRPSWSDPWPGASSNALVMVRTVTKTLKRDILLPLLQGPGHVFNSIAWPRPFSHLQHLQLCFILPVSSCTEMRMSRTHCARKCEVLMPIL